MHRTCLGAHRFDALHLVVASRARLEVSQFPTGACDIDGWHLMLRIVAGLDLLTSEGRNQARMRLAALTDFEWDQLAEHFGVDPELHGDLIDDAIASLTEHARNARGVGRRRQ